MRKQYTHPLTKFPWGYGILGVFFALLAISFRFSWNEWKTLHLDYGLLLADFGISFLRVTIVAIFATGIGIIGGYGLYYFVSWERLGNPFIHFVRHISPFAWLPFAILWFGLGEIPIAFVLFITLFFPTLVESREIFVRIPSEYLDEAYVCGADVWQLFWHVELPLSASALLNLFRIQWGLGWATVVAVEMLGVQNGMGFRLLDFRYLLQYPQMLIYFIIMGICGIVVDWLIRFLLQQYQKKFC